VFKNSRTIAATAGIAILLVGCSATASMPAGADDYVASVSGVWYGAALSDADLVAYGQEACAAMAANANLSTMQILPGSTAAPVSVDSTSTDKNNWHVIVFATSLCPDVRYIIQAQTSS